MTTELGIESHPGFHGPFKTVEEATAALEQAGWTKAVQRSFVFRRPDLPETRAIIAPLVPLDG